MGLKVFGPGGIDQKSNDLLRDPKDLRDSLNIVISDRGEYEKREGTDQDTNFSGDTYSDVVYIKSLKEYFFRNGSNYYSYKSGSKRTIVQTIVPSTTVNSSPISGVEYLNTFIFTHQDGQRGTFKYDGNSVYFAGLPTPIPTISETGSSKAAYVLSFFDFIDAQGNQIFGPSSIKKVTLDAYSNIQINTLKDSGFYNGFILINTSKTLSESSLANRTLTYTSKSSDVIIGSKIPFRTSNTGELTCLITEVDGYTIVSLDAYIILEVESFTGSEIVFKSDGFKGKSIAITVSGSANCMGSLVYRYFFSEEEVTGYTNGLRMVVNNTLATQQTGGGSINLTGLSLLSDIYDITTSKLRPPKCKYITAFGSQIVCGGVISFFDFENKETTYTNNDLVMYSDVSIGDLGENFSETNRQLIGQTYDGEITGLVRYIDSIIVFKDRGIYSIDGILIPGQYSLRKILSNEIGCLSDKSILVSDSIVIFQSHDGLYLTNGYKCMSFSDTICKFFETIDPTKTRSVMYNNKDMYLFFTNQGVVAFDFEFQKFFIWSFIDASKGVTVDETGSLRIFDSDIARKFISAKRDFVSTGVYTFIDGYIKSAWFDQKEPSLLKKITGLRLFSLNNVGQTLTAQIFHDWDESKLKAPITISMPVGIKSIEKKIDIQQAQSFSFYIRNNIIDENINLSGYEIETNLIQGLDKND